MSENQIVDSSFTAIINAPIDKVDILARSFSLPECEVSRLFPNTHRHRIYNCADGKRMSINVEFAAEFGYEVTVVRDATLRRHD